MGGSTMRSQGIGGAGGIGGGEPTGYGGSGCSGGAADSVHRGAIGDGDRSRGGRRHAMGIGGGEGYGVGADKSVRIGFVGIGIVGVVDGHSPMGGVGGSGQHIAGAVEVGDGQRTGTETGGARTRQAGRRFCGREVHGGQGAIHIDLQGRGVHRLKIAKLREGKGFAFVCRVGDEGIELRQFLVHRRRQLRLGNVHMQRVGAGAADKGVCTL